jgi:hypothetical protein
MKEAKRNVRKPRSVAICDGCGSLVLGYGNEDDLQSTMRELDEKGSSYEHARIGDLYILSKRRNN